MKTIIRALVVQLIVIVFALFQIDQMPKYAVPVIVAINSAILIVVLFVLLQKKNKTSIISTLTAISLKFFLYLLAIIGLFYLYGKDNKTVWMLFTFGYFLNAILIFYESKNVNIASKNNAH